MIDPTLVMTYCYRHEAELARTLLETEGIEAMIQGDDCGGLGIGLAFSGGISVYVAFTDADRARAILEPSR